MKTVIKRDNDGHQFEIPDYLEDKFDRWLNYYTEQEEGSETYYDAEADFNDLFSRYMVG